MFGIVADECFVVMPLPDGPVVQVVFVVEGSELTLSDISFHRFARRYEKERLIGERLFDGLGKPVTAALLRDLPLTSIIERAFGLATVHLELAAGSREQSRFLDSREIQDLGRRGYRKREDLDDELLSRVADAYQSDVSGAPRRNVAETLHTSERTASRWIAEARKRGLLGEEP